MRRKAYPDPMQHLERHLQRSAEKYLHGLEQAGLQPTPILTRAIAERAYNEAKASYIQEATQTRNHNIAGILEDHHKRMNAIKKESASLRLKMCPPIILVFSALAWYCLSHANGLAMGIVYAAGALAFLAMLVLGAIFDRPRR